MSEATAPGWRTIDSAPRDGTEGLLIGLYPSTRIFSDIYHGWWDGLGYWARWPHPFPPTYWMPLPEPPAVEGVE